MKVPFLDLGAATEELGDTLHAAARRVIDSGWYIGGPEVERFEANYADYLGVGHVTGVGNGLDALTLSLRAMDIGPGDEVIVAANGYVATLLAVTMAGARPVPVEPDPATHNLDPTRIEAAITSRTRAILPTHLYGQPAELDPMLGLARAHGLRLIEDAAQAHGATYRGRRVGGHGDAVTWSFYPSKNLGALGDGGAVSTNDEDVAARVRTLGNYGSRVRYVNDERGVNSRLDPLQAALLDAKLGRLDEWNGRRAAIANRYRAALADSSLDLPFVPDHVGPVWHLFVVTHETRDALARFLAERNIQTLIHYPVPPHLQKAYADHGWKVGDFPIAQRLADTVLSLPIGPHMTGEQVDAVIAAVQAFDSAGG